MNKTKIQELILLSIAAITAIFWVFTQHLTFSADSTTYLQYAQWLTGHDKISAIWYLRTPALPLVLILTGVTKFQTFTGFMWLQAAISVLNVWLCYKILQLALSWNLSSKWNLSSGQTLSSPPQPLGEERGSTIVSPLIGLIAILAGVPFAFSSMVTPEHLNLNGYLWLIFSLLLFLRAQRLRYVLLIVVVNLWIFFLKPVNQYVWVISLLFITGSYWWVRRCERTAQIATCTPWRAVIWFLGCYFTIVSLYSAGVGVLKTAHPGYEGFGSVFQGLRAIVYQPYEAGNFKPELGPANAAMQDAVSAYAPQLKQQRQAQPKLTAKLARTPAEIFSTPNGYNYNALTAALVAKYGKAKAEKLLLQATLEVYRKQPLLLLNWVNSIFTTAANNYTGQMLYYPLYLKAPAVFYKAAYQSIKYEPKVSATDGPATAELFKHLRHFIDTEESKWLNWSPPELFAKFKGNKDALFNNIFQHPSHVYHWFMWQALDREIGPAQTSALFLAAAKEGIARYPEVLIPMIDDFYTYFFGPDVTYQPGMRTMSLPNPGVGEQRIMENMAPTLQAQILAPRLQVNTKFWDTVYISYGWFWLLTKGIICLLAVVSLAVIGRNLLPLYLLTWSLALYNALICSILADVIFRYSAVTWFLLFILAIFGFRGVYHASRSFFAAFK
jgi:hypothetical protein